MNTYQQQIDAKASALIAKWGIPNVAAVMVRDHGNTVLSTAKGVRDASQSASLASNQVDTSDYFNVGSISKPIFGMLLACLIKQGLLDWTTTIGQVFPEFTSPAFRARCGMNTNFLDTKLFELTAHTSGIDGWLFFVEDGNSKDPNQAGEVADPFKWIDDWTILGSTGSNPRDVEWQNLQSVMYRRYLYTVTSLKQPKFIFNSLHNNGFQNTESSGYGSSAVIAAAMVERRAGKPFEQLMTELLASTIPMQIRYGPPPNGMQLHNWANGKYVVWMQGNKPFANGPFASFQPKFLTGTISCTVQGMAQFIRYNLNVLANLAMFDLAAYHQQVTSPAPTGGTVATNVTQGGLALSLGQTANEPYWHNGQLGGTNAWMEVYPSAGHGLAVMVNADGGPDPTGSTDPPDGAEAAMNELRDELRALNASWP